MRIRNLLIAVLFILSVSMPPVRPAVSEGVMAELFNGLADVVERNMNNPSQCLAQLQEYIAANKSSFMEWKRTVEANAEKARTSPQQMPSQQDWQKMQAMMENSPAAQAMNRWTQTIMNFMMRNPEMGDRVQTIMEDISPRPAEYR